MFHTISKAPLFLRRLGRNALHRKKMESILLLTGTLLVTGCGVNSGVAGIPQTEENHGERLELQRPEDLLGEAISMEDAPVLVYERKEMKPHFLVDYEGYASSEEKCAYLYGDECPSHYYLWNVDSGECVLQGELKSHLQSSDSVRKYCKVDFTEVTEPGRYQLSCDIWGYSEVFEIKDSFYTEKLQQQLHSLHQQVQTQEFSQELAIALLHVYEWNSVYFKSVTPQGAVPEPLLIVGEYLSLQSFEEVQPGDLALWIGILSKFGYLYQNYDVKVATESVQKAAYLYQEYAANAQIQAEDFYALTELYRVSGQESVGDSLKKYAQMLERGEISLNELLYLDGGMTYIVTRQPVSKKTCDEFVELLLSEGERISKEFLSVVAPGGEAPVVEELLRDVTLLINANYILKGYQYNYQVAEILHYMQGRNMECLGYSVVEDRPEEALYLYGLLSSLEARGMLSPGASADW